MRSHSRGEGARLSSLGATRREGGQAIKLIRQKSPDARVRFEILDLASLASIAAFAQRMAGALNGVDLLINNAAVMNPPVRKVSGDGFELQFATNYLGHFALTAHLLPVAAPGVHTPRGHVVQRGGPVAVASTSTTCRRSAPIARWRPTLSPSSPA